MMNPRVVRQHYVAVRPVPKQSDDTRVRPVQHSNDSPFEALPLSRNPSAADFDCDVVAVHRIFRRVPRNENVSLDIRDRLVRNHKSVAILVKYQSPADANSGGALWILPIAAWRLPLLF